MIKINLDDNTACEQLKKLKCGDRVELFGTVYTARDAAHGRLKSIIESGASSPIDFCGKAIYYAGPTETPKNSQVGSIGPTTSARMDKFAPLMNTLGVIAVIGKGERSEAAKKALTSSGVVYFIATGGCGALLSSRVTAAEVVAFHDLGCESIKKLTVCGFPVTVAYDLNGGDIFNA